MLKIWVNLQHKYDLLAHAHFSADARQRPAWINFVSLREIKIAVMTCRNSSKRGFPFPMTTRHKVWSLFEWRTYPINNKDSIILKRSTIKKLLMIILLSMNTDMNFCPMIIASIIMTIHEKSILKSPQVPLKQSSMGHWLNLVVPAVLVKAHLSGTH